MKLGEGTLQSSNHEGSIMRLQTLLGTLTVTLALSGCANMSDTQRRSLEGGAMGAAGGAVIGSFSGDAGKGALIGAAAGLAGGFLYDQHKKGEQDAYQAGYKAGRSQSK